MGKITDAYNSKTIIYSFPKQKDGNGHPFYIT